MDIENYNLENYSRFWDGGVLSNTPLRELIQSHKDYWKSVKNKPDSKNTIPELKVYIIDIWPSVDGYPVPSDLDGIRDRKNDLTYQDVTPYDEKVANMISDYYNLSSLLKDLAEKKGATEEVESILNTTSKSSHRNGELRTYRDLVDKEERFDISKVIRIERSADKNDIANKWCDFSLGTISKLFEQGTLDALKTLAKEVMKEVMRSKGIQLKEEKVKEENIQDAARSQLDSFIIYAKNQGANGDLIQSAESVKDMLPVLM